MVIESPGLPGIVIRARRLTLLEAQEAASYRLDTKLDVPGIGKMSAFLTTLGFVIEDGGKPYTATDFLLEADLWTVQAVFFAILSASAFDPEYREAPPAERPAPEPVPESPRVSPE